MIVKFPDGGVCRHLRLEVLLGGVFGFCRSWQSLSLMLIVSSGASRHTKIQLGDKSIRALKIQHFISAPLLRKLSANTFPHSFPLAAVAEDDFHLMLRSGFSTVGLFMFGCFVVIRALNLNIDLMLVIFLEIQLNYNILNVGLSPVKSTLLE